MMYEVRPVRRHTGEPERRWFVDDRMDLLVWTGDDGGIVGFQLCYDRNRNPHALTWHRERGYAHHRIDQGEGRPGRPKSIPLLVADGRFPREAAGEFRRRSAAVERRVADFVLEKLRTYPGASPGS